MFWMFVGPLFEVLIYAVVFSQIISIRSSGGKDISYTLYLTSGLFPFFAFSQMLNRGSNAINKNALLMRRALVPAEVFVLKEGLLVGFTFTIYLIFLVVISVVAKNPLTWRAALMPVFAVLLLMLSFGMALILANLRILFPDIGEVMRIIIRLWRWTLPIFFSDKGFDPWLRRLMSFNPPYYFIRSFRDVLIDHTIPPAAAWLSMVLWIVVILALASFVSNRLSKEVKDLI
jgi:ABC-type polysaccharide/polyol phosphate export permease